MGRPDVKKGVDHPDFLRFLELMARNDNIWSKVTCPERLSAEGPPAYGDVVPFAQAVVERFPDRVLWGTDWPHPNMKSHMPDDGDLVDFIPKIARTPEQQRMLLVDKPDAPLLGALRKDGPTWINPVSTFTSTFLAPRSSMAGRP